MLVTARQLLFRRTTMTEFFIDIFELFCLGAFITAIILWVM